MPEDGERVREDPPEKRPRYDDYVRPARPSPDELPRVPATDAAVPAQPRAPARSWWRSWLKPLPPSQGQLAGENWFLRAYRPLLLASGTALLACLVWGGGAMLLGRKDASGFGEAVWAAAILAFVALSFGVIAELPKLFGGSGRKDEPPAPPPAP